MSPSLKLQGFTFSELFHSKGLMRLDQYFLDRLLEENAQLHASLLAYRNQTKLFTPIELSEFLIKCAEILENFLIDLFDIDNAASAIRAKILSYNPISSFKKSFVLRKAKKNILNAATFPSFFELDQWLGSELLKAPIKTEDRELATALLGNYYLTQSEKYLNEIEKLTQWCTQALVTPEGKIAVRNWTSFRIPERLDYQNLVPTHRVDEKLGRLAYADNHLRLRDGFNLTDPRMTEREVQDEANYCIYCHDHDGDFCSKGFPAKKGDPTLGFKKNPLDVLLVGCPLEEKISEMNLLRHHGNNLAALAMVMIDNPMCPATGHRICNDCMKACIYQKQEPVNIPQIETRVLTDVLDLPWGVEIYDLLTRWNPLRQNQWVMKPYNGLKILIAGMGPAGFTLAHHMLLEGFAVVGFDGLKIEPLPEHLIKEPIYQFNDLKENLDSRLMAGFGGVAEYGITVRWDKNFLKLIYISLMRKPYFQVFGSTRFGGTIMVEDAWAMGFDHFVIAVGAGLPKALPIPGSLAPGMRQANDFLMALQLGNAAKKESLTNIQVRLPAVIIGGGLTGVDTATEVQAYYVTQVEKILERYEILSSKYMDENILLSQLDVVSREILEEFLSHGKMIRKERERAHINNEHPNFIKLIRQWGGVTIVYRRTMQESPAYINNHEELRKALEEGIYYLERLEPVSVDLNQFGHVETLICHERIHKTSDEWESLSDAVRIPARSIFVATGTQPNIAYAFEHRGTFNKHDFRYQTYEEINNELIVAHGVLNCKDPEFGPFTSYQNEDHRVSLIGDTHPVFHGNVVKAIASGLRTYPKILDILKDKLNQTGNEKEYQAFANRMNEAFATHITQIIRRTENVIELTVRAPQAVKHFRPGQFYRLQNYETYSQRIHNTILQTEPLALIAADVNREENTLTFIVIENGASTKICSTLRVGETVSLMGPTGARPKISFEHETILIMGDQLSIATLRSYGLALKAAGNRVIYHGHFTDRSELYCQKELETCADIIIWSVESGELIPTNRPQDFSAKGNNPIKILLDLFSPSLKKGGRGEFSYIPLTDLDRIYIIGNTNLLREFQQARKTSLKDILVKDPLVFGSVYSTMQCMLKGVCAQCLQWQIDPETGKRTKAVFACSWQDQPLELIDFDNIDERLIQNRLQEKISDLWIDYIFQQNEMNLS